MKINLHNPIIFRMFVLEFKDKDKEIRDKNSKEIVDFEIQLAKDLQKIEDDKQAKKVKEPLFGEAPVKIISIP